nr:MAG TPA: hypothetical protein [Caudoviricetes sp.]
MAGDLEHLAGDVCSQLHSKKRQVVICGGK